MDGFLTQEEVENIKSSMFIKRIKFLIKNYSIKKTPGPDGFTGEFYQTLKEEIMLILYQLFQKTEEEESLPVIL